MNTFDSLNILREQILIFPAGKPSSHIQQGGTPVNARLKCRRFNKNMYKPHLNFPAKSEKVKKSRTSGVSFIFWLEY